MKRLNFISVAVLLATISAFGQVELPYGYYLDAARFSQTTSNGSARIQGLGNSQTALGADVSTIGVNPAGLGLINRTEISFTTGAGFYNSDADYYGNSTRKGTLNSGINQLGIAFTNSKEGVSGWLGGTFGISYNKTNDFNNLTSYIGDTDVNSIVDHIIESSDGANDSQFPSLEESTDIATLAYYNFLINPMSIRNPDQTVYDPNLPEDLYFSDLFSGSENGAVLYPVFTQEEEIITKGGQYQWNLSYGGNYSDLLYFGFGLGISKINYEQTKNYYEYNFDYSGTPSPSHSPINSVELEEIYRTNGTGINGTFGLIFRPMSLIRIGASVTTPTLYNIRDTYEASLGTYWDNYYFVDHVFGDTTLNDTFSETAIVESSYRLTTPLKINLGAALFLSKLGFITLDAEYVNYSNIKLDAGYYDYGNVAASTGFNMNADNNYIRKNYGGALNIRTGAEIRFGPMRFRAGYSLRSTPTSTLNTDNATHQISGGFGVRKNQFFLDLAIINSRTKYSYSPYFLNNGEEPIIDIKNNNIKGVATLGFKF